MSDDIEALPPPAADVRRIAYDADRWQFGDLRLPVGPGPHPVVITIHGGFWRARYGLDYLRYVAAALTAAGLATWNIEYRRIGNAGGGWPGTFLDVAAAADHLGALATTYPLELGRVVALGHSAGGHLAYWLAGRPRVAPGSPLYAHEPLPLAGAVALAGVLDLRRAWELRLSDNATAALMGGAPDDLADRYDAGSPRALLPLGIRQVLVHGTTDDSVPYEISADYAAAARAAGDPVELLTLSDAGHFECVDTRTPEWRAVLAGVQRLAR